MDTLFKTKRKQEIITLKPVNNTIDVPGSQTQQGNKQQNKANSNNRT